MTRRQYNICKQKSMSRWRDHNIPAVWPLVYSCLLDPRLGSPGSFAHVHMDEGIDVVGLEDVELVEPGALKIKSVCGTVAEHAELLRTYFRKIISAFSRQWQHDNMKSSRLSIPYLSGHIEHLALMHSLSPLASCQTTETNVRVRGFIPAQRGMRM